jgi:hypothetical protein
MYTKARAKRATGGLGDWTPGKKVIRRVRINKMLLHCRKPTRSPSEASHGGLGGWHPQERKACEG